MMSEQVYRWGLDCGRMGDLEGVFVSSEQEIAAAEGKGLYFYEVLGKHSEIGATVVSKDFEVLSSDSAVIAFVKEHGPFGHNPFDYFSDEEEA